MASTRSARRRLTAEDWWHRAREAGWAGRPARGVACCRRALEILDGSADRTEDRDQDRHDLELRGRVLLTMAYQLAQLGEFAQAMASLDLAADADTVGLAMVRANRAVILHVSGRAVESQEQFDAAIADLERSGAPLDHSAALLNRGNLFMTIGRIDRAIADTTRAYEIAADAGFDQIEFMSLHNLGWAQFLAGDLPKSLDLMAQASQRLPASAQGVPSLDRARVLTAAGMFSEAKEAVDRALSTFTAHRAETELVDALLASGELALLRGDQLIAKQQARKAERISTRRQHRTAALLARLLALRADAVAFDPVRSTRITPPTRSTLRAAAAEAAALADALGEAGLTEDARTARLVDAGARLMLGDLAQARAAAARSAAGTRKPNLGIRLHQRLVNARIELADGERTRALAEIARGLDDLTSFMATFGSQDMQAAASVHGGGLARIGLRTAVDTGQPRVILPWLERSRAATTRLPALRPPNDPELVAQLAQLRVAVRSAREATMAGKTDRRLEQDIIERRARIRARTWTTGAAKGKANRPITLTGVQRYLREHESDTTVLAYFRGQGRVHALVVTARRSGYLALGDRALIDRRLARIGADLDLLAAPRISGPVRTVATRSLTNGLRELDNLLVAPVAELIGAGRVRIAVVGRLGTAPWNLLPGLAGRAVSVTPSITTALAPPAPPAHLSGVLAVAGPDVRGGREEAAAVGERHPGSAVLLGEAATGEAVLAGIPHGGLLHIAAHGHHVPESPMFSAVLLADGPLFGYDIAPNPALPDHVVLSSCDVGQSADQPGGEPLGLAAALLRSGVRTVVAGVSRINDNAAAAAMIAYHDRLLAGADPATALSAALDTVNDTIGDVPVPLTCFGA